MRGAAVTGSAGRIITADPPGVVCYKPTTGNTWLAGAGDWGRLDFQGIQVLSDQGRICSKSLCVPVQTSPEANGWYPHLSSGRVALLLCLRLPLPEKTDASLGCVFFMESGQKLVLQSKDSEAWTLWRSFVLPASPGSAPERSHKLPYR